MGPTTRRGHEASSVDHRLRTGKSLQEKGRNANWTEASNVSITTGELRGKSRGKS